MTAAATEFSKRAIDSDLDATFPYENWEDLKRAGLLGICIPTGHGGLGGDFVAYALARKNLAPTAPPQA